jgi:hypothetical protein
MIRLPWASRRIRRSIRAVIKSPLGQKGAKGNPGNPGAPGANGAAGGGTIEAPASFLNYNNGGPGPGVVTYFGADLSQGPTEATIQILAPSACTLSNLTIRLEANGGVPTAGSIVLISRKNGVDQTSTLTFNAGDPLPANLTDTAHQDTYAEGDLISIKGTNSLSGGSGFTRLYVSFLLTSPSGAVSSTMMSNTSLATAYVSSGGGTVESTAFGLNVHATAGGLMLVTGHVSLRGTGAVGGTPNLQIYRSPAGIPIAGAPIPGGDTQVAFIALNQVTLAAGGIFTVPIQGVDTRLTNGTKYYYYLAVNDGGTALAIIGQNSGLGDQVGIAQTEFVAIPGGSAP